MNIKTRLALQFTLIVAVILLFFSVLVYYFSYSSQLTKFRQNLLDSAKNTATLLINVEEVDSSLLEKIHRSTISWDKEELVLTDSLFHIRYSYNTQYLSDSGTLASVKGKDLNYFSIAGKEGVFYRHIFNNRSYYVYAMAFDKSRIENLTELRRILFWSILFSTYLSIIFSYFFARRALKPISKIIKSVKDINSLKLSSRLEEGNIKDEIGQLSLTFNEMLSNLEIAFKSQEDFVTNASHELRTPLTVMIGESDYFLNREREKAEYVSHISRHINDLKNFNSLINSLLELAQVNRDKSIVFSDVRVDEIVFTAIRKAKEKYKDRKILPKIIYPENGNELVVRGNSELLGIAFKNLIDNACKFSDKEVIIEIIITDDFINILISDKGIGIPSAEIGSISKPFKRASNVRYIGGYGIGLALVYRIIELHKAELTISSKLNEGSKFELKFKRPVN